MPAHRLLAIEDDKHIAALICTIAKDIGFDTRSTCQASEIQSIYDEFKPHAIVLDIIMPDMDGFEVLKFLHARISTCQIVILSGEGGYRPMLSKMAEMLELTIAATVAKPFRLHELRATLEKIKFSLPTSNGGSSKVVAA